MSESEIVKYQTSGGEITLSPAIIRKFLVSGQGKLTDQECMMFLALCKYQKLNPFLREVYLIKYGNEAATMVTGKETFLKRAAKNEKYAGHKTGISSDGKMAWAEIFCHGHQVPIKCEVDYSEYVGKKKDGTVNRMWKEKPRTMLKKVALVQALREAFPQDFGGMYSQEEINTIDQPLPVDSVTVEKNTNEGEVVDAEFNTETTEKSQLTVEQQKLWVCLVRHCGADKAKIAQELKARTAFTVTRGKDKGKQVEGKASFSDVSDSQAKTVRHQIEAELKKKETEKKPAEPEILPPDADSSQPNKCLSCDRFSGCMLLPNPSQVETCKGPFAETQQEAF